MANQSKLKAWVRYDGTNTVVTAGPIFRAAKPKVGNWRQINADLCCNPSGSTTTTTTQGGGGVTPTAWVVTAYLNESNACNNLPFGGTRIAYTGVSTLTVGTTLWANAELTIPFNSDSGYVKLSGDNNIYTLSANTTTVINGIVNCTPPSSFYGYAAGSLNNACAQSGGNPGVTLYADPGAQLGLNTRLYFDSGLTSPYVGQYGDYFNVGNTVYQIGFAFGGYGYIVNVTSCFSQYRLGSNAYGDVGTACNNSGEINSGITLYSNGPAYVNGTQLYYDSNFTSPFTDSGWYPSMVGWPSGSTLAISLSNGIVNNSMPCP